MRVFITANATRKVAFYRVEISPDSDGRFVPETPVGALRGALACFPSQAAHDWDASFTICRSVRSIWLPAEALVNIVGLSGAS